MPDAIKKVTTITIIYDGGSYCDKECPGLRENGFFCQHFRAILSKSQEDARILRCQACLGMYD